MRIAIVGAGAAGLTAAYGLRDVDGVSVQLFEKSADAGTAAHSWASTVNLQYLSRRALFGESVLSEAPLEQSIEHYNFALSDGESAEGFSLLAPGDERVHTVTRGRLDRWMLERLESTDTSRLRGCRVKSLVRRNHRVVGLHTDSGIFRADLVFLAEGDSGRLLENEDYSRLLPGQTPNYLAVTQQRFQGQLDLPDALSGTETGSENSTVSTFSLPSPAAETPINVFGRILPLEDGFSFGIHTPLNQLKNRPSGPRELFEALKDYPVLKSVLDGCEPGEINDGLIKTSTAGPEPNLVDHGLVLGGSATGAGSLLPVMNKFSSATQMGYQFSGMVRQLNRKVTKPTRATLRKYYASPLRNNPEFLHSDPDWTKTVWEDPIFLNRLTKWYFSSDSPDFTLLLRLVSEFPNALPLSLSGLLKTVGADLVGSLAEFSESYTRVLSDETTDVQGETSRVMTVLGHFVTELIAGHFSGDESRRREARSQFSRLMTVMGDVMDSTPSIPASDGNPTNVAGIDDSSRAEGTQNSSATTVSLGVGGSLEDTSSGPDLNALCPAGVFDLRNGEISGIRDASCIRCQYCYWAVPEAEVRPSGSTSGSDGKRPIMTPSESLPVLGDTQTPVSRELHQCYTFLERLKNDLDAIGHYVTPEQRSWLESYGSLARRQISTLTQKLDRSEEDIDELLSVIRKIERALASNELAYAGDLCEQVLSVHLSRFESFGNRPGLMGDDYESLEPETAGMDSDEIIEPVRAKKNSTKGMQSPDNQDYDALIYDYYEWYREVAARSVRTGPDASASSVDGVGHLRNKELQLVAERNHPDTVLAVTDERELSILRLTGVPEPVREMTNGLYLYRFTRDAVTIVDETSSPFPDLTSSDFTQASLEYQRLLVDELDLSNPPVSEHVEEEARRTYYGPRITTAGEALAALRDFPVGISESPDRLNWLKQLAASVVIRSGFDNPMMARTILADRGQQGLLCFDELDFLRCFPFDTDFGNVFTEEDLRPRGDQMNALLSLTDPEEQLWTDADQDGVFDDLIRQWRRTAGDARQAVNDDGQTDRFKTVLVLRLFVARCLITKTQYQLRCGQPTRRTKLSANLWMRRTYEWRETYQRPEDFHPEKPEAPGISSGKSHEKEYSPEESFYDGQLEPKRNLIDDFDAMTSDWIRSLAEHDPAGESVGLHYLSRNVHDLRNWLTDAGTVPGSEVTLIGYHLVDLLNDWMGYFDRLPSKKLLDDGDYRYWQRVRSHLLTETSRSLYSESVVNRLETVRQRALNEWWDESLVQDEDLIEQVQRAFDRADRDALPYFSRRPNLVPWYRSFWTLLTKLHLVAKAPRAKLEFEGDNQSPGYDDWRFNRLKRSIRTNASLVAHGMREAGNNVDAPEAQLRDIGEPESIYRRR